MTRSHIGLRFGPWIFPACSSQPCCPARSPSIDSRRCRTMDRRKNSYPTRGTHPGEDRAARRRPPAHDLGYDIRFDRGPDRRPPSSRVPDPAQEHRCPRVPAETRQLDSTGSTDTSPKSRTASRTSHISTLATRRRGWWHSRVTSLKLDVPTRLGQNPGYDNMKMAFDNPAGIRPSDSCPSPG